MNTALQEAPDLPLWESTPVVSADGYRVRVAVPDAPPRGTTPNVFLGSATTKGTEAVFDLRFYDPDRQGRATPRLCLATDGDFSVGVRPPAAAGERSTTTTTTAGVASVTLELDGATEVESVFARRCDRSCVVEVSRDGSAWVTPRSVDLGPPDSGTLVARFPPVAGARFVRVSRPGGALAVTEISAWPARPPGSPGAMATSSPPTVAEVPASPGRSLPVVLPVAAAVLLGAVAGALALAVGGGLRRGETAQSIAGLASVGLPSVA